MPLLYLGTNTSSNGAAVVNDLKDHWSYGPHRAEQIEMLRALRRWKEARIDRDLLVLGGDVHIGGHTEVIHEDHSRTVDGNARVGTAFLAHLLSEFDGDVRLALAAYYRGPAGVRRFGIGPETSRFVANVLALRTRV